MAMRARKKGESRGDYAKYVKEYRKREAVGPKYTQTTVKRKKPGASTREKARAAAAGMFGTSAAAQAGMRNLTGAAGMAALAGAALGAGKTAKKDEKKRRRR